MDRSLTSAPIAALDPAAPSGRAWGRGSLHLGRSHAAAGFLAFALCAFLGAEPAWAVDPVRTYTRPGGQAGDGAAVAGVGPWLVAGGQHHSPNLNGHRTHWVGKVVVFEAASGLFWREIQNPTPDDDDLFGASVAALGSTKVIVGAPGDDAGAADSGVVYVFEVESGRRLLTIDNPDPDQGDGFGTSVAKVSNNMILVGAPLVNSAYLFDGTTGRLLRTLQPPHPRLGDLFGAAVAGAANGFAIVGAPGDDDVTGTVFVFDSGTGDLELTLGNPEPADGGGAGDSFGAAVDARFNGDILVGAPGEDGGGQDSGAAYLFSRSTGELLQSYANPEPGVDNFGSHVAVVPVGDHVLVGAMLQAYLFDRDSGDHLSTFNPWVFGDHLGLAVGSGDSGLFVGGGNADGAGAVYLFPRPGVPEMSVHGNYIAIVDGDMTPSVGELTDFGDVNVINGGAVTHTFLILNLGDTALHLTGNPRVSISGAAAADFTVTLQPPASVAARRLATFKVQFDPSRLGWRSATISIDNDDANEGPYNFNIRGRGL